MITYSATDNAGNIGTATRTIHVIPDTTPPVITLYGDSEVTMYLNQYYSEAGASCNDNLDGNCNGILTASGNVDTSQLGDYIVTYSAMDNAGNIASATRNVHVIADTEPPVFTLYGDNPQEIAQYADYSDLYGDCTDNAD